MTTDLSCVMCLLRRQEKQARQLDSEDDSLSFFAKSMHIIAEHAGQVPAPVIVNYLRPVSEEYFGKVDRYAEEKNQFNRLMLSLESDIARDIENADDPLHRAVLYARAGNYIDFGALPEVSEEKLREILQKAAEDDLDEDIYSAMLSDLQKAHRLVYLLDNCGEIVLDKLLIAQLRQRYPHMHITAMTRGGYVLNDATEDDAYAVGLDKYALISNNGTTIPGTWRPDISISAAAIIEAADIIISKGQANFETLTGSGMNIYYLLLCKCRRFEELFGLEKFSGMFLRERSLTM